MSCTKNNEIKAPNSTASNLVSALPTQTDDNINVSSPPLETVTPSSPSLSDEDIAVYYPIRNNTLYSYEGVGNEYAAYDVHADYTTNNAVQERVSNSGTITARVIRIENGRIIKVYSQGETYYRENFLKKADGDTEILLMEPLEVGTTWKLSDGRTRTITNTSFDIDAPLGSYKALEVTTQSSTDKTYDYYVKDIGLIKTIYVSNDFEVSSTLKAIKENTLSTQDITFYYPSPTNKIQAVSKTITFQTNANTKELFEAAYKEHNTNYESVFTENTQINSLYLNTDGAVYIDLNDKFQIEVKKDADYEKMVLQCIANTFGYYYNVENVYITIDNKPYQTKSFSMKKGEVLKVNLDETAFLYNN
jgi:hypothetical protein